MAKSRMEGPDLERLGIFKEMSYLEEHVPTKLDFNESSKKGKQMLTHCSRSVNASMDGYFDKAYPRVFEGEAYSDTIRLRRLHRLEEAKKNIGRNFKYTSPAKTQCGSGSNYGTFGEIDGKKVEYFSSQKNEVEPGSPPKKNFYANPPKKGSGYGYANLTIGKTPPYMLDKEYEELKNAAKTPHMREPRSFEPYRAGTFQNGYFDPNPYKADESLEQNEEEEDEANEEDDGTKKVFQPTNPAKKDGGMKAGCLSKFPEYMSEPADPEERKKDTSERKLVFRPVPGPKPYPIKSIITKNVQRKVTPQNFSTIKGVVYCKNTQQQIYKSLTKKIGNKT